MRSGAVDEVAAVCESEELASKVKQAVLTSKRMRLSAVQQEREGTDG